MKAKTPKVDPTLRERLRLARLLYKTIRGQGVYCRSMLAALDWVTVDGQVDFLRLAQELQKGGVVLQKKRKA